MIDICYKYARRMQGVEWQLRLFPRVMVSGKTVGWSTSIQESVACRTKSTTNCPIRSHDALENRRFWWASWQNILLSKEILLSTGSSKWSVFQGVMASGKAISQLFWQGYTEANYTVIVVRQLASGNSDEPVSKTFFCRKTFLINSFPKNWNIYSLTKHSSGS